ncbi:prepilin-type N-terminal cleavage/methylation domain-containing protein [Clostridia bacterium]|nr:prepilin-type N-terminal cleavage/methylation domain-containing protein [Clostridia bacterium]
MNKIFSKLRSKKKGFTLIELIVVIVIIGILAAVMIPQFSGFTDKAKSTQALVDAKQIATAYDALKLEQGDYSDVSETEVETMSGVTISSGTNSLSLEDDGGFEYEIDGFTAGRDSATDGVALIEE